RVNNALSKSGSDPTGTIGIYFGFNIHGTTGSVTTDLNLPVPFDISMKIRNGQWTCVISMIMFPWLPPYEFREVTAFSVLDGVAEGTRSIDDFAVLLETRILDGPVSDEASAERLASQAPLIIAATGIPQITDNLLAL